MSERLALKYRPRTFEDVAGQNLTALILTKMVEKDAVPTGLLFSGPSGCGKTTAARILASRLCGDTDGAAVVEVDAAGHGLVADVRAMADDLRYAVAGDRRIVIYDEAQAMSRDAFGAMLKILEEPPHGTTFVLVTTEPEKIPETIKTRLIEFEFNKISVDDVYRRIEHVRNAERLSVPDDLLVNIAQRADGNLRGALMALEQAALGEVTSLAQWRRLRGEDDWGAVLVAALLTGDPAVVYPKVDALMARTGSVQVLSTALTEFLRDLLVLRSRGQVQAVGQSLAYRERFAARVTDEQIMAAMRLLWDLSTKLGSSGEPRSNFQVLLAMLLQIFSGSAVKSARPDMAPQVTATEPATQTAPEKVPDAPLTLADLR